MRLGKLQEGPPVTSLIPAQTPQGPLEKAGRLTPSRRRLYLASLARGNTMAAAYKDAGVTYGQICRARARGKLDPQDEARAYAEGTLVLEQEATRRGRDGTEELQLHQGQVCYHQELRIEVDSETGEFYEIWALQRDENGRPIPIVKKQYSDNMLKFVLGSRDPARYRDQRYEVTGAGGGPVEHRITVEFVK